MPAYGGVSRLSPQYASNKPKKKPDTQMDTYPASILQAGQDYDELMNRYRSIADTSGNDPRMASLAAQYQQIGNNPISSTPLSYQRGPEMDSAIGNLSELSRTGGYSDSDVSNLRARGVSPIRSVYANAMQNITRQKALQGGYSPNYTASMAKLTRGLSQSIADQATNVEAGIAQNRASNRLSAAPQYAGVAQQETGAINDIAGRNEANRLTAAQTNAENQRFSLSGLTGIYGDQNNQKLEATKGMASLYGTTPANPALYGSQALSAAQLTEQQKARKQNTNLALSNLYASTAPKGIMAGGTPRQSYMY